MSPAYLPAISWVPEVPAGVKSTSQVATPVENGTNVHVLGLKEDPTPDVENVKFPIGVTAPPAEAESLTVVWQVV